MSNPDNRIPGPASRVASDIELLEAELGADAVDGLYSIIEGGEDITCFSAKKLKGRRDKNYDGNNIFKR